MIGHTARFYLLKCDLETHGVLMPRVTLPDSAGPKRRPLATVPDMAAHYGVSEATIRDWHHRQVEIGPLMFRRGKYLRARWDDIDKADAEKVKAAQQEAA